MQMKAAQVQKKISNSNEDACLDAFRVAKTAKKEKKKLLMKVFLEIEETKRVEKRKGKVESTTSESITRLSPLPLPSI